MITRDDTFIENEFHAEGGCTVTVGPRGGLKTHMEIWRRNGATKSWVRRSDTVVPVKYGMYAYGAVYFPSDASLWHKRSDCPVIRHFQNGTENY